MHVVKRKIIKNAENQSTSSHFMVLFPADIELYFEIYFCSLNVKYTSSFLLEIFWLIANWTKYIYFKYVLEVKNWSTLYVTKNPSLNVLVKSKKKKKEKKKRKEKRKYTYIYRKHNTSEVLQGVSQLLLSCSFFTFNFSFSFMKIGIFGKFN